MPNGRFRIWSQINVHWGHIGLMGIVQHLFFSYISAQTTCIWIHFLSAYSPIPVPYMNIFLFTQVSENLLPFLFSPTYSTHKHYLNRRQPQVGQCDLTSQLHFSSWSPVSCSHLPLTMGSFSLSLPHLAAAARPECLPAPCPLCPGHIALLTVLYTVNPLNPYYVWILCSVGCTITLWNSSFKFC